MSRSPHGCIGHNRASRRRHRDQRGQAVAIVAISIIALVAMAGLALDGGMAAGNYRQAQNAGDSGALAAARQIYETNATATKTDLCGPDGFQVAGTGPRVVSKNRANPDGCIAKVLNYYVAGGGGGFFSYSALSTVDSTISVPLVATNVTSHIGLNEVTAQTNNTAPASASGTVDLASQNASVTLLAGQVASANAAEFQCSSSKTTPGPPDPNVQPPGGGTCPGTSLGLTVLGVDVNAALGVSGVNVPGVLQQSSSSSLPSGGMAQQQGVSQVVNTSSNPLKVLSGTATINANAGSTTSQNGSLAGAVLSTGQVLGGGATGVQATSNLVNVGATVAGVNVSINGVDAVATVSWDGLSGFKADTSCVGVNGAATGTVTIAGVVATLNADCTITPITVAGVLTVSSTKTTTCAPVSGGLEQCTASVCVLNITVTEPLANSATLSVCIGKATATGTLKPATTTAAVVVTGQIPTPTYFLRVLGTNQTTPSATGAAMPQQISDESSAAFANAPVAVTNYAHQVYVLGQSQPYCVNNSYGPLQPGCTYWIHGANVDSNSFTAQNCPAWKGKLTTAGSGSPHTQGHQVKCENGTDATPSPYISSASLLLLPIIDSTGMVVHYGLFKPVPGTSNQQATLVQRPDPSSSLTAPIVQFETNSTWIHEDEGAVGIKLVDANSLTAPTWTNA